VFELVSSEDQAKMEAAKMQADLMQSQQQKQTFSAINSAAALDETSSDVQGSGNAGPPLVNTPRLPSVSIPSGETGPAAATVTAMSSQPSRLPAVGFTPFAKNPEKQKRYEAYLESIKTGTSCESVKLYFVILLNKLIFFQVFDL